MKKSRVIFKLCFLVFIIIISCFFTLNKNEIINYYNDLYLTLKIKYSLIKKQINTKNFKLTSEIPFAIQSYNSTDYLITPKTIIVSHFTFDDNNFIKLVIQNHRKYAKLHQYDYWFRNGIIDGTFLDLNAQGEIKANKNVFVWQKIAAIQQAMELKEDNKFKYEWIMWLDTDAVFTNLPQSLENLRLKIGVTDQDYLIIARDMSCDKNNMVKVACLNGGVFLIKNNEQGKDFIKNIIDHFEDYYKYDFNEQHAIEDSIFDLRINIPKRNYYMYKSLFKNYNKCNLPIKKGIKVVNARVMNSGYNHNNLFGRWHAGDFIAHFAGNKYRDKIIPKFLNCMQQQHNNLALCENIN